MAKISFPLEAFDQITSKYEETSTHIWAGVIYQNNIGYFAFEPRLKSICLDMGISPVIIKAFTQKELKEKLDHVHKINHDQGLLILDELARTKGHDKWDKNLITTGVLTIREVLLHKIHNPPPITIPQKTFLLLCDDLEVSDHFVEQYLMVKMSV